VDCLRSGCGADVFAGDRSTDTKKKKVEHEGVFVLNAGAAMFRRVKTGIVGATDIEIPDGIAENEELVIGTFQVLRTLKDTTGFKIEKQP
jgi:HlyD family secretion protein